MKITRAARAFLAAAGASIVGLSVFFTIPSVSGHSKAADETTFNGDTTSASLSCEQSRRLDISAAKTAKSQGKPLPGPAHYPPFQSGFAPNATPEPAPFDPVSGLLKDADIKPLAQRPDYRGGQPDIAPSNSADNRPCGGVVDKIRDNAQRNGAIVCFLKDGRYASTVMIDSPGKVDSDSVCKHLGYDRSDT